MTHLAQQQAALVQALFAWPAQDAIKNLAAYAYPTSARGLKTYQSNGHALAQRALAAAYPVLAQLLGEDSFADLARALWHAQPPQCGDVGRWGAGLADFIQNSPSLADTPYLPDMARVEWAYHRAASAADAQAQLDSLAWFASHAPEQLGLRLAPGCAVYRSAWPIASLWAAHHADGPRLQQVAVLLQQGVGEDVLVWRSGWQVQLRAALAGEVSALQCLLQGGSVAAALEAAPTWDFSQWLPQAVPQGVVLGVRLLANEEV